MCRELTAWRRSVYHHVVPTGKVIETAGRYAPAWSSFRFLVPNRIALRRYVMKRIGLVLLLAAIVGGGFLVRKRSKQS
jgi:hypothetical protein